jgi:ATP-dependent Zn protease
LNTDDLRLKATAFHEAGHTVAAWCLYLPFSQVTIVPSPNSHGSIEMQRIKRPEVEIICTHAGSIAEAIHSGHFNEAGFSGNRSDIDFGSGSDRARIKELLLQMNDGWTDKKQLQAIEFPLFKQARRIVESSWGEIEIIASALLKRQTLTAQDVINLIGDPSN